MTPGQKAQQNNVIHFIHSNHLANWKNDLFTYFPGILEYLDNLSCKEGTTPEKINEKKLKNQAKIERTKKTLI